MNFVDDVIISVQSGNGGRGGLSFRREKFIPRGGPDGGDGGKGGDVILVATTSRRTLHEFRFKRHFAAENGAPGQSNQKTGRGGRDTVIELPVGTIIKHAEDDTLIADLCQDQQQIIVVPGGRGGKGNTHFKTSTHRTPRFAQPGEPGRKLELHLELKLLADVGLMGLPNAGKSTLIAAISAARPKIADYPFTTLTPNLGVVAPPKGPPFVVADIPGVIEGAHQGAGLGIQFLRHLERTRLLLHVIDAAAVDPADALAGYRTLNRELALYRDALAAKPQVIVLNKMDLPEAAAGAAAIRAALTDWPVFDISARNRQGLAPLILHLVAHLGPVLEASPQQAEPTDTSGHQPFIV